MQRLLIISVVAILAVTSVYWAQTTQTTRPSKSSIVLLLRRAADLKGDDYVQSRDRILQSAKTQAARDQLAQIAKDPKTSAKSRLLADLCLLRLKDDSVAKAFYSDLGQVIASVFADKRVWMSRLPPNEYLLKRHPSTILGLDPKDRRGLRGQNNSLISPQHKKAAKRLLCCDEALFAECLIWHTDATLQETLMSDRSKKTDKDDDISEKITQWPTKNTGWVAQVCASWFLVVKANTKSVEILEMWGKSDDGARRSAMRDLMWIAKDKQLKMSVRHEAILAYAHVGGKATLKVLESVKEKNPEKGIRNAADEAIRQIKGITTAPAPTTKPAKIPTTRPTTKPTRSRE